MAVITLPPQALIANQWFFSTPTAIPAGFQSRVEVRVTDPANQWFVTVGAVKEFGMLMENYVGGPWDNQGAWAGWGWFTYNPGGDVLQNLILPATWTPFGRSTKNNGVTPDLYVVNAASNFSQYAGRRIRLGIQTDTNITLGVQIILT